VIGTASARHHEYLRSIGVDEVIDYTTVDFEDAIAPVDAYLETVNSQIATQFSAAPQSRSNPDSGLPWPAVCGYLQSTRWVGEFSIRTHPAHLRGFRE
jgi:hypothetical protein